jgi:LmbE family N-acetylglucosaminyl deacetylase
MKKRKIMGIFAHPDDDTFGPGGTFVRYSKAGHEVHILTATAGQAGLAAGLSIQTTLGEHREKELKNALSVMGVKYSRLLDFYDGTLNEHQIPLLQHFILEEVQKFEPDVIITYERSGISLHLDHIAVTKAVISLYDTGRITVPKIYYFGLPREIMSYFGREGGLGDERRAIIDINNFIDIKEKAMKAHASQEKDWRMIIERSAVIQKRKKKYAHHEYFQLARTSLSDLKFPEDDLLAGIY